MMPLNVSFPATRRRRKPIVLMKDGNSRVEVVDEDGGNITWASYLGRLWDEFDELGRIDDVGCWIDSLLNVLKY